MTALLFKNFIRSKGMLAGLLALLVSGLVSLYIGGHFQHRYRENIAQTEHFQQETIDRYVKFENKEMGLLLYYLRFGLVNDMPALAGLAIGQRDVHPSVQNVTIRNLEEQKYNADLVNPMHQLLGNLDFSFVLIYFFPLIIIGLCYSLISEEKEEGTWSLVLTQAGHPAKVMAVKIGIRYASVMAVLAALLLTAKVCLGIPFEAAFAAFALLSVLYVSFWFALSWWVVSLHRASSQNALMLLTAWVLLTIVVPVATNAYVINRYPVPEAFATVVENRDGYHTKWDVPKSATLDKFYAHYPQFQKFKHPEGYEFSWLWYYAMQQMGDDAAARQAADLKAKLRQRDALSAAIGLFFPSIHTQLSFNDLAQSGLKNQLQFMEAIEQFHERKRLYFYPKIFGDAPVLKENWQNFPVEYFSVKTTVNWLTLTGPLLLLSLLLLGLGNRNMTRGH